MPNWITNKITAPKHVIAAIINDNGYVDFRLMAPFPGPRGEDWNGIYCDAETAAEKVLGERLNESPIIAALEAANRRDVDIKKMSDSSFQQFIGMLENHRACGYLHGMAWARDKWGTKWNACESSHDIEAGTAKFETAWACPKPVLAELSKRFPEDEIAVIYADEDIGSNCGTFTLKAGETVASDIAPRWRDMDDAAKAKWSMFAYKVKGYSDEEIAEMEGDRLED